MLQDENLDSRLLNREEEEDAAGRLKEEKNLSARREKEESYNTGEESEPKSLRQKVMAARQAVNLKELAKRKLEEKALAPAKQGTNWLLKMSWLNIIDSFGLTLIYINLHVFLKFVLGEKLFCKLGEEWLPKQITEAGGEPVGKGVGLVEIIVLLILDLIVLLVIFVILALIVMIVDFMQAGIIDKVKAIIGGLTGLGWTGIKTLYNLFAPKLF